MLSENPKISVIIPAHNAEKYIEDALESVAGQTYPAYEIIVVDDGSTDTTSALVESFAHPSILLTQPNRGASAARNLGISRSHSPLVAFLDADDLWLPTKLELQVGALQNSEIAAVFGHVVEFFDGAASVMTKPKPGYSPITMLARREIFSQVGLFSSEWSVGEFVDWWARAKDHNVRELMLDSVVAKRRIHGANQGVVKRSSRQDYAKVLAATIQRRRKQAGS